MIKVRFCQNGFSGITLVAEILADFCPKLAQNCPNLAKIASGTTVQHFWVFLRLVCRNLCFTVSGGRGLEPVGGDLGESTCGRRWVSLRKLLSSPRVPHQHAPRRPKLSLTARWPDLTGACAPEPATERRAQAGRRQKANSRAVGAFET